MYTCMIIQNLTLCNNFNQYYILFIFPIFLLLLFLVKSIFEFKCTLSISVTSVVLKYCIPYSSIFFSFLFMVASFVLFLVSNIQSNIYIYLYTLAISPSLGGSRQHKRTTKTMGNPLRSSSNDEGPSRVWMALLEQHSPSSPVFHNLRRFTDAISPTAPTTGLPL